MRVAFHRTEWEIYRARAQLQAHQKKIIHQTEQIFQIKFVFSSPYASLQYCNVLQLINHDLSLSQKNKYTLGIINHFCRRLTLIVLIPLCILHLIQSIHHRYGGIHYNNVRITKTYIIHYKDGVKSNAFHCRRNLLSIKSVLVYLIYSSRKQREAFSQRLNNCTDISHMLDFRRVSSPLSVPDPHNLEP